MHPSSLVQGIRRRSAAITAIPFWILAWPVWPPAVRSLALRPFGPRIDRSARLKAGVRLQGQRLSVGARSVIEGSTHLDATAPLEIGEDVHLGARVTVLTTSYELAGPARRAGRACSAGVLIEDGAWIGAGATILAGVVIGAGAVIAEGAVVGSDCAPDTLYAGVPARPVQELPFGSPLAVVQPFAARA